MSMQQKFVGWWSTWFLLVCLMTASSVQGEVQDLNLPPEEYLNSDPAFSYHELAPANAEHRRNSVASMIQLDDGRVMIAYDDYGPANPGEKAAHDFFASKVVSRISGDGGKTWSKQRILLEPKPEDFTIQAPGLLKLASGDILLTCIRVYKGMETGKDWDPGVTSSAMALYRSTDGGKSFVEEPPIWKRAPVLRYQGGGPWNIQLKSGRVLLSYHSAARQYAAPYTIGVAFSDDDGHTWKVLDKRVALSDGYGVEPSIAELADGSLMMSIRTKRSQIYLSRSTDQGETWSKPVPSGLTHPASITRLIRILGTKDLLIFFNNTPSGKPHKRAPCTAALSRDGGRTWRIVGNIVHADKSDPRGGIEVGVADVIFPSDNKVLVAFSWTMPPWARHRIPTCAAVIDLEWFYRPVSRQFHRKAHPRLYPAEQKESGRDVEPLEPDASILKNHLMLWLKADAINPDDTDCVRKEGLDRFVKQWVNHAGDSTLAAVQSNPARQPKFVTGVLGRSGKPAIRFEGEAMDGDVRGHALSVGSAGDWKFLHNGSDFTIMAVLQTTAPQKYLQSLVSSRHGTNSNGFSCEVDNRGQEGKNLLRATITGSSPPGNVVRMETDLDAFTAGRPHLLTCRHASGKSDVQHWPGGKVWVDTQWQVEGHPVRAYSAGNAAGPLTIGDRPGAPVVPLAGDLAELLVFRRALSDEEIQGLEKYLIDKYQLDFQQ